MLFISAILFLLNAKGSKHRKARKYLKPAYVNGGISFNPHLIIIKEVDHKNVTSRAMNIEPVWENSFLKMATPLTNIIIIGSS